MADWIFQSVARLYDLPGALKEARRDDKPIAFRVRPQYEPVIGDTVYLCFGGPVKRKPGLYATATVLTSPDTIKSEDWERRYEVVSFPVERGVWLKIQRYLDPPVARDEIYGSPALKKNLFVTRHEGTNFKLTPAEARAFEALIAGPRPLAPQAQSLNSAFPVAGPRHRLT
jgi:hypothetical protein